MRKERPTSSPPNETATEATNGASEASPRTQRCRSGAQHVMARRARRRRRSIALGTSAAALVLVGGAAWAAADLRDGPVDEWSAVAGGSFAAETEGSPATSTPTTSTPENDLLAPPPTVVPTYDVTNGLAPLVQGVDTTDRVIFITIDDGIVREPEFLERFDELGVPFSSFITQPLGEADPDYWRATLDLGGTVQTHTINHPDLRRVDESTVRREVCEPADTFTELFGERPTLFRPPYGNSSDTVRRVAAACGYRAVVLWTGSANNGELTMQRGDLRPGDIVLMHYRDTMLADLDDVVARARAEEFRIGRLEDYLAPGRVPPGSRERSAKEERRNERLAQPGVGRGPPTPRVTCSGRPALRSTRRTPHR